MYLKNVPGVGVWILKISAWNLVPGFQVPAFGVTSRRDKQGTRYEELLIVKINTPVPKVLITRQLLTISGLFPAFW